MKITDIKLNCRSEGAVVGLNRNDFELYFIRSQSVCTDKSGEHFLQGRSVIIYNIGSQKNIRPLSGRILKYDRVAFRLSSAEKQYVSSMNIEFDTAYEMNDDSVVSSVLKNLKSAYISEGKYSTEFMDISMRMIFISIGEKIASEGKNRYMDVPHYTKLRNIRDMIYEKPMLYWDIEEICSRLGISRTYFHRIYSEAFGVSFRHDVIRSRIMYASDMLVNTDYSVSEIAEKSGYESESYFMKQFRQYRGCTPTEYRRNSDREIPDIFRRKNAEDE